MKFLRNHVSAIGPSALFPLSIPITVSDQSMVHSSTLSHQLDYART